MIGIVILNYNNWKASEACIESVFAIGGEYRIYHVDNASPAEPTQHILELLKDDRCVSIINQKNMGYNSGNNVGVQRALEDGCDAIIISNNDVQYLENSIEILEKYLEEHKASGVGIVAPRELTSQMGVRIPTAYHTPSMDRLLYCQTGWRNLFRKKARSYEKHWPEDNMPFEVYAAGGGCFMMSRECALKVTPFDEYPFLYCEEWMLGAHMEKLGLKTVVVPSSRVIHNHGATMQGVSAFSQMHMVRSEIYYCKTYLNASRTKIWVLYASRTVAYLCKSIKYRDYRKNLRNYFALTTKELFQL